MEKLEELLRDYRPTKARYAYLRTQEDMLERFLSSCERSMVSDQVSMSQAITGMPHGSNVGDPVGRLAIDIASGKVSEFVRQIREEIENVRAEMAVLNRKIKLIEIILGAMTDRELEVIEMKIMADMDWDETLRGMNEKHNNSYSKRTLQRMLSRALDKAEEVVK
jgi:hypothetical protein